MSLIRIASAYARELEKQAEMGLQSRPKDLLKNRIPSTNQPAQGMPSMMPFKKNKGLQTAPKPLPMQQREQNRFKFI